MDFCLKLYSNFLSKYKERSKKKPPKSKILIFFVKNKFYIVYIVYVIDSMVKNAMYEGFWTKINILRMREAQKWSKMAIFSNFFKKLRLLYFLGPEK